MSEEEILREIEKVARGLHKNMPAGIDFTGWVQLLREVRRKKEGESR